MAFTTQYVPVLDGGVPRTITGVAREAISGGQFVTALVQRQRLMFRDKIVSQQAT